MPSARAVRSTVIHRLCVAGFAKPGLGATIGAMVVEISRSVTLITARPGLDIGDRARDEARRQGVPWWVVPTFRGRRVLTVTWEWTERADAR